MDTKQSAARSPLALLGIYIALGLIIAASIGSYVFYQVRLFDGSLSVVGSARTEVTSDQAKWTLSISRQAYETDLASGYDALSNDLSRVLAFFAREGVASSSLDISPVSMQEDYAYNYKSGNGPDIKRYNLIQTIKYSSSDVQAVSQMAKAASSLVREGVTVQSQSPEYYYSKLADLRVSLLSDAIKDAKARAEKLVDPSGQSVGPLKAASLGVVQVLAPDSVDISDYGTYDTSSIAKEVMVTVHASFSIR